MKATGFLLLLMLNLPAWGEVLTWNQCVELATKNNAELQSNLQKLRAAEDAEGVVRAGFFPQVSGALNFARSGSTTSASADSYTATLSASENLFNGLQDLGKVRQARANTAAMAATVANIRAKLSYDLKTAYQNTLYAQEYQALTAKIIQRRLDNSKMVRLRFDSGRENKGSVLLSDADLDQSRLDNLVATNAARVAQSQMAKALGLDETTPLEVREPVPTVEPPANIPDMRKIAEKTPDQIKVQAEEEAARQGVTIARSQFFPTLSLTGAIGKVDSEFWPEKTDTWTVGVALTMPLFNGGKDYYGTRNASDNWRAAESNRVSVGRDLILRLQQSYASYLEGVAKFKVDASYRQAVTVRAEIARQQYNNGLITFQDWNTIENDLIARESNYLKSKRDRVLVEAGWEQVQGKGVIP